MHAATRKLVRTRAGDRCEYCGLDQDLAPFARFHIEHVIPRQQGDTDDSSNLALACNHCNWRKGTNLAAIDPDSGQTLPLFHPRRDLWREHFERSGAVIVGLKPTGRAMVRLLAMNTIERIELRSELDQ